VSPQGFHVSVAQIKRYPVNAIADPKESNADQHAHASHKIMGLL